MNKKKKIVIATFVLASTFSVACGVLAISKTNPMLGVKGTPVVDTWTEKAYVAPTGSDVGYKHYYLGCPGNYRTSDAEHNEEVSLEDITIPALNVIQASEVTAGSEILNVIESKIKYCDQSIDFADKDSGGHAVFVQDQGHEAIFFSRSNNLGENSTAHPTEFRFSKNAEHLTSVSFDYRYLDYNSYIPNNGENAHIFTQTKNRAGEYPMHEFNFVNDDQWHSATIYLDSEYTTIFVFKIYDFQGHLYVSNLQYHGIDELALEAATGYDAIAPVTVSDLGVASGTVVPNVSGGSHLFMNYDFNAKKGIDFWFRPKYSINDGHWAWLYLFNKRDESGFVFRYDFNRIEDDGIGRSYIYTQEAYGGATTVVQTAGAEGTFYWFPRASGVKSSADCLVHLAAYCLDESVNLYRVIVTMGVVGGTQYYPSTNPEDTTNTPIHFDIELGANFFNNATTSIRYSSNVDDFQLFDAESTEQLVAYRDADGSVLGKKTGNTVATFDYQKSGKTLVGWFDQHGKKMNNGQQVTNKTVVRPVFVDNQTDMIVPSTVKMGSVSDTDWYEVNSSTVTGETASEVGYTPVDNRIDMYFIYEVTAVNGADNWALFGFPYDFLDAKSRLIIRINENNNNRLDGYIYGASLGDAGAEGTYFNVDESYNFRLKTDPLLVHISIVDNGSNNITFTIEFTDLVNGKVGSATKSVTFTEYSAQTWARNKMCLIPATGCEWRFKDAF